MRKVFLFLWFVAAIGAAVYHYGPGQDLMKKDMSATLVQLAKAAENKKDLHQSARGLVDRVLVDEKLHVLLPLDCGAARRLAERGDQPRLGRGADLDLSECGLGDPDAALVGGPAAHHEAAGEQHGESGREHQHRSTQHGRRSCSPVGAVVFLG